MIDANTKITLQKAVVCLLMIQKQILNKKYEKNFIVTLKNCKASALKNKQKTKKNT